MNQINLANISPESNYYFSLISEIQSLRDQNTLLKQLLMEIFKQKSAESSNTEATQQLHPLSNKSNLILHNQNTDSLKSSEEVVCKEENTSNADLSSKETKEQPSVNYSLSPGHNDDWLPENTSTEEEVRKPKIRRRNEFKPIEEDSPDTPTKNGHKRSRVKHLWVTYGRKIVEYAYKKTEGEIKDKIKTFENELVSKKSYTNVFLRKKDDTQSEKQFKVTFGQLALEFIQKEAENSFLSSNYRDELLNGKYIVAKWIENLIKTPKN